MFQISGVDPRKNGKAPGLRENIFAYGDCSQTSLDEEKGIVAIKTFVYNVYFNVIGVISGGKPQAEIPNRINFMQFISVGPLHLIQVLNGKISHDPKGGAGKKAF